MSTSKTGYAKRRHFCHEEIRLNRRFTTGIYLGVVELRHMRNKVCFGKQGQLLDYAVQMRRLPEERMLNSLIEAGSPELAEEMSRLGLALHKLIGRAKVCRHEAVRNAEVVKQNCSENFLQTRAAIGTP